MDVDHAQNEEAGRPVEDDPQYVELPRNCCRPRVQEVGDDAARDRLNFAEVEV